MPRPGPPSSALSLTAVNDTQPSLYFVIAQEVFRLRNFPARFCYLVLHLVSLTQVLPELQCQKKLGPAHSEEFYLRSCSIEPKRIAKTSSLARLPLPRLSSSRPLNLNSHRPRPEPSFQSSFCLILSLALYSLAVLFLPLTPWVPGPRSQARAPGPGARSRRLVRRARARAFWESPRGVVWLG